MHKVFVLSKTLYKAEERNIYQKLHELSGTYSSVGNTYSTIY